MKKTKARTSDNRLWNAV